jgi:hypothetical protein
VDRVAARGKWLGIHLATLVLAAVVLVWVNRDQWFSADEWIVITTRGLGSNPQTLSLLAPHFEHWTTLPILVFKALYGLTAMRSYWPYTAVLIAVQLGVTHMLWRVLLRVGVHAPFATAVAAIFAVMAVGFENVSTAWQMTIIAPLGLGFGALLLLPERGVGFGRRDVAVWVLLVLGLMCSGTGVTMTAIIGIAALLRRGWKLALADVSVPALVYATWYVTWGTTGQHSVSSTGDAIRGLPDFVWHGVTRSVGEFFRVDVIGPVVVLALAAWLVWRARRFRDEPWPIVLATSIGAVLGSAFTGLRRVGADGSTSRYAYVVVALLLPALALAVQDVVAPFVRRHGRVLAYAAAGILVAFMVVQVVGLNDRISNEVFVGQMEPRTLVAALLMRENKPVIVQNLVPFTYEPTPQTVARLDAAGELPSLDGVTHQQVLTQAPWLQMTADSPSTVKYPVRGGTCRAVSRATDVPLTEATSLTVTSDRTAPFGVEFRDAEGRGEQVLRNATANTPLVLNIARAPVTVRLSPARGGSLSICGIPPAA